MDRKKVKVTVMLKKLQELNPTLKIFDVASDEFSEYGRIIAGMDTCEIIRVAEGIRRPSFGSEYLPSVKEFEELGIYSEIKEKVFGTLDTQVGYCHGYSDTLGATEWHHSSEFNIAITPLVLILAKRSDIKDGKLDSSLMKAFYLPAGTAVEVYATTTHFCPCQVTDGGFGCVVALPQGTNVPLTEKCQDPLLFRRNKWIICHNENTSLIERGVVAGIYGENYKINY